MNLPNVGSLTQQFRSQSALFEGQPPWELETLLAIASLKQGDRVTLCVYGCRAPKHQHEHLHESRGPTSRFQEEISGLFNSVPITLDVMLCPATAATPVCGDLAGDLRAIGQAQFDRTFFPNYECCSMELICLFKVLSTS